MKKIKSERGQSLVELSIGLVIVLWLLAGAVEFGIAVERYAADHSQDGQGKLSDEKNLLEKPDRLSKDIREFLKS